MPGRVPRAAGLAPRQAGCVPEKKKAMPETSIAFSERRVDYGTHQRDMSVFTSPATHAADAAPTMPPRGKRGAFRVGQSP